MLTNLLRTWSLHGRSGDLMHMGAKPPTVAYRFASSTSAHDERINLFRLVKGPDDGQLQTMARCPVRPIIESGMPFQLKLRGRLSLVLKGSLVNDPLCRSEPVFPLIPT